MEVFVGIGGETMWDAAYVAAGEGQAAVKGAATGEREVTEKEEKKGQTGEVSFDRMVLWARQI